MQSVHGGTGPSRPDSPTAVRSSTRTVDQAVTRSTPLDHALPEQPIDEATAVSRLLDGNTIVPVFQPIVDLCTARVHAYEALARGPRGHHLESPAAMFAAARSCGMSSALDATCLRGAVGAARAGGLTPPWTLFVNIEPDSRSADVFAALATTPTLPVVVELTERALTDAPAEVLETVRQIRRLGFGVALDDVGVNSDSLALLPFIVPDVIKLDATLVQRPPDEHTASVFSAVAAEVERTGCIVVAEGIETAEHLQAARALGAHLGQGWLFARPGPLPTPLSDPPRAPLRLGAAVPPRPDLTPFGVVAVSREVRTTNKALLLAMSKHLERQAAATGDSFLVLATFQTAAAFARAAQRYTALAETNTYVAVFGSGITDHPARGVRGIDVGPEEPLSDEWDVVVIGPHFAVVLAARPTTTSPGARWDYVLSYDRSLAVRAASTLMNRITGAKGSPHELR